MPGLLDLPPELLENVAQRLLPWNDRAHLQSLRLSCRRIEEAIRRCFRPEYFNSVRIRKLKDANIQKLCAIATVPDLAESIERIGIYCSDDGTADPEVRQHFQQRDAPHPLSDGRELLRSSGTDHLIPMALLSHKEALLAALLATKNVTELEFTDYHWLMSTSDGNEWEHPDLPAPRPRIRIGLTDFICDISSTFNFVMSLIARAGLAPKWVSIHSLDDTRLVTGLTTAIGLVTWKQTLLQLESLELVFVGDSRDDSSFDEVV